MSTLLIWMWYSPIKLLIKLLMELLIGLLSKLPVEANVHPVGLDMVFLYSASN